MPLYYSVPVCNLSLSYVYTTDVQKKQDIMIYLEIMQYPEIYSK
jgi:hypothetical protein